ncbi:MAG: DUF5050 domain-containing protein [Cytophagales bacterium]|nr:DUF5050 domain-containing protein [Cytophagales bacterium]
MATSTEYNLQGPHYSPDGKSLLYKSKEDTVTRLMKISLDDLVEEMLYETNGYLCCYQFSRDGQQITFNGNDGDLEVFRINSDGTNLQKITDNELHDGGASWTYDNEKLVLTSVHNGDFNLAGIYWMNPNGTEKRRLHSLDFRAFDPSVSHDGKEVLAQHVEDGNLNIFRISIGDGSYQKMTSSDSADWYPEWSPDDRTIAFRNNESGDWDIFLMNRDGSNLRKVTSSPQEDRVPVWSPDGSLIAYQSRMPDQDGFDIWLMDSEGKQQRNLTQDEFDNQNPNWSPDGKSLVYSSKIGKVWQLMSIDADGSGKRLILPNKN